MSDTSSGEGWWLASDGKWYSPLENPGYGQATPAPGRPPQQTRSPMMLWIGLGLFGLFATFFVVAVALVVSFGGYFYGGRGASDKQQLPTANLTVFSDGCGVIRSEFDDEPNGLTWSIQDSDGFEVLGRNAANETHYRYFQSGTYTVMLKAFDGDKYVPVSNPVTINC